MIQLERQQKRVRDRDEVRDFSTVERAVLCAVATVMDRSYSDLRAFDLLALLPRADFPFDLHVNQFRSQVAFEWWHRKVEITSTHDARSIAAGLHNFPYTTQGLFGLIENFEAQHGPIWSPEVRDGN